MSSKNPLIASSARSSNPMDWLYDNPLGKFENFGFGVLRRRYRGHANSAQEFGRTKLQPVLPSNAQVESCDLITASRVTTTLPRDADDRYACPWNLLRAFDEAALDREPALLVLATFAFPHLNRLHHAWEAARMFANTCLSTMRELPVVVCQHVPGLSGSDNPPHVHLLIGPRRLDGTGFRGFDETLITDGGQKALHDDWLMFMNKWEGLFRSN